MEESLVKQNVVNSGTEDWSALMPHQRWYIPNGSRVERTQWSTNGEQSNEGTAAVGGADFSQLIISCNSPPLQQLQLKIEHNTISYQKSYVILNLV
jgi:hypothetical protein